MTTITTLPNGTQILSATISPAPVGLYETARRRFHLNRLTTPELRRAHNTIATINNRDMDNQPMGLLLAVTRLTAIATDSELPQWLRKSARHKRRSIARRAMRRFYRGTAILEGGD